MKYEELTIRRAYDDEYRWKCRDCGKPLNNADIRHGNWRTKGKYVKDISRCCDAIIIART